MFVSDIHGNIECFQTVISIFKEKEFDKLIFLGDTAASNVEDNEIMANALNQLQSKVEVIRGNCDNALFETRLDFEIFDTDNLYVGENVITITHGNGFDAYHLPPYCGNVFIQGHTHVPMLVRENGMILANPGSIARPRGTNLRCYLALNETQIWLNTLNHQLIKSLDIKPIEEE